MNPFGTPTGIGMFLVLLEISLGSNNLIMSYFGVGMLV